MNSINNKVKEFWDYFEAHKTEDISGLLHSLNEKIKEFSEGLFVDLSLAGSAQELIITPHGNKEFFADAFELVNHAPSIDEWSFLATKPAVGTGFNFQMGNITIDLDEITFMPLDSDEYPDDVAIRLYHKDYTAEEGITRNSVIVGLYTALDMLLGEVTSTFEIQYADFDDMPHPKEKDFPFSELPAYIENKKAKRKGHGLEFPDENIALLEGKTGDLPMLLVLNQAVKYYEFKQQFPYLLHMDLTLLNVTDKGLPTGNTDELYILEDVIYKEVPKKEKGHFVATETFNGKRDIFYYADSKETIENVLKLLPTELTTCKLETTIQFDPFWVRVGGYF